MKIRPIFKTIDIFSFIQFLSRQTNYIIKFFLLKVLYLVRHADTQNCPEFRGKRCLLLLLVGVGLEESVEVAHGELVAPDDAHVGDGLSVLVQLSYSGDDVV